jgi:peroxiredoxin
MNEHEYSPWIATQGRLARAAIVWLWVVAAAMLPAGAGAAPSSGEPLPEFDTSLLDGRSLPWSALRDRPLIIVVWATWCPPCHRELRELQALYEREAASGLRILALSVDADAAEVSRYVKTRGLSFDVAMSDRRHAEVFGPAMFPPKLFVVSAAGRVEFSRWGPVGIDAVEDALRAARAPQAARSR